MAIQNLFEDPPPFDLNNDPTETDNDSSHVPVDELFDGSLNTVALQGLHFGQLWSIPTKKATRHLSPYSYASHMKKSGRQHCPQRRTPAPQTRQNQTCQLSGSVTCRWCCSGCRIVTCPLRIDVGTACHQYCHHVAMAKLGRTDGRWWAAR